MAWTIGEDQRLRELYSKGDKDLMTKEFGRKWGTIWLRAKKLGLTRLRGSVVKKWSVDDLEKLFDLTEKMADPKDIARQFPGVPMDEIFREAEKIGADICYMRNREVIRKSIDIVVDAVLVLNINGIEIKTVQAENKGSKDERRKSRK